MLSAAKHPGVCHAARQIPSDASLSLSMTRL